VESMLAVVIGGLYAAGMYLMVRRSIVKMIFGLALLGNAANLLIFTVGRLTRGRPPHVPADGVLSSLPVADPVPQALILTAIVIGFGVQAFALVLIKRVYQTVGSDDQDEMVTENQGQGARVKGPEKLGQGSGVKGQGEEP
jgi:multicomponent Na+:H+ antiporter subunit C